MDVHIGFVRILDAKELENTKTDLQRYVPHLPVLNPNKPDKIRRVCNAASKFGGVSLNANLMAGPIFYNHPQEESPSDSGRRKLL